MYVVVRARVLQLGAELAMLQDFMDNHLFQGAGTSFCYAKVYYFFKNFFKVLYCLRLWQRICAYETTLLRYFYNTSVVCTLGPRCFEQISYYVNGYFLYKSLFTKQKIPQILPPNTKPTFASCIVLKLKFASCLGRARDPVHHSSSCLPSNPPRERFHQLTAFFPPKIRDTVCIDFLSLTFLTLFLKFTRALYILCVIFILSYNPFPMNPLLSILYTVTRCVFGQLSNI
jgi:hypothetical protein